MSARIEEILEVVGEVKSGFSAGMSEKAFRALRIEAVEKVAKRRRIGNTTVSDKFRRQLQPDIANTAHFDRTLRNWLSSGDHNLRSALLAHAETDEDESNISKFFSGSGA